MTPLKTGALALTLILVIPIMLGFAMATEDVEETVETTENAGSLSDLVLNSTTPYYIPYTGANNNGNLYRVDSGGNASLQTPDYVSVSGSNYTFTPVYGSSEYAVEMENRASATYTDDNYPFVGLTADTNIEAVPSFLTARFSIDAGVESFQFPGGQIRIHDYDGGFWVAYYLPLQSYVYVVKDSNSNYIVTGTNLSDGTTFTHTADDFYFRLGTVTMQYTSNYTDLSSVISADTSWSMDLDGPLYLFYTYNASHYVGYIDATGLLYSNHSLTISYGDGSTYAVTVSPYLIGIAVSPEISTTYYRTSTDEVVGYADITEGWSIPTYSGTVTDYWFNGYTNYSMRMMVHLEAGEQIGLNYPTSGLYSTLVNLTSDSDGIVTLLVSANGNQTATIGSYEYLMVEVGVRDAVSKSGTVVVSGIPSWPSFGQMPSEVYNSATLYVNYNYLEPFDGCYVGGDTSVEIRVDATDIVGGYFPSTNGYYYRPYSLFPDDKHQSVVIDSVGIYGDHLNLGGVWRPLSDNNAISFRDADTNQTVTASVLGLNVEFVENDDGDAWTTYINGHRISEHASAPFMVFDGEWSLTLHRNVITEETVTSTQWQAGEFAFTQDDFILCMILSSVLVFVGLGLMRGVKIGVLAVVCSAAGIIAFMIA